MSDSQSDDEALASAREQIDALDRRIHALINQRAEVAVRVAEIKQAAGRHDFYRPEREAQVLEKVAARNEGPLSHDTITTIMREIMSACLALEKPMTVAYLGPEGTYTQSAVLKQFGHAVAAIPQASIGDIFREVESGKAQFGVVPVENSTEGVVTSTLDQLANSDLTICGEVSLPVHHHLLSHARDLGQVRRVVAHAQSLAQCRQWLNQNLPDAIRESVASNGEAARRVSGESNAAAIAARAASDVYSLPVLASNIEDDPGNTTRFLVLGTQPVGVSGNDMTTVLVSIKNQPGMLHRLLAPAAEVGVDLARIESRPSRRKAWDYNFFIDMKGHVNDDKVKQVIEAIRQEAAMLKVLGSYPCTIRQADEALPDS